MIWYCMNVPFLTEKVTKKYDTLNVISLRGQFRDIRNKIFCSIVTTQVATQSHMNTKIHRNKTQHMLRTLTTERRNKICIK